MYLQQTDSSSAPFALAYSVHDSVPKTYEMRDFFYGLVVASFGLVLAVAQGPQLSLYPCNASFPTAAFEWNFFGNVSSQTAGAFVLNSTGQCVTYNATTTNLVLDTCAGTELQQFTIRPDGTFFNPSSGLCWDSQYYGNQSGSVLGLYMCSPGQQWGMFSFNGSVITNVQLQTLCVNGGHAPPPFPTPEQLSWMRQDVSLMVSAIQFSCTPAHFCLEHLPAPLCHRSPST